MELQWNQQLITTSAMPNPSSIVERGVVGTDLKVDGILNLRVVDSSIIPVIPSAHIQSVVYAVAEKVYALIENRKMSFTNTT